MTTYAIECLSALARIDFDLILAVIPRLLPRLLLVCLFLSDGTDCFYDSFAC